MNVIYDRASAAAALARPLSPPMMAALRAELALLTSGEHDLTDCTDIVLVEPGDTSDAIAHETGFDPLTDPLSGAHFPQPGFEPVWDLLTLTGGVFRMVVTYGSTFATVLLVPDDAEPALLDLCHFYTPKENDNA